MRLWFGKVGLGPNILGPLRYLLPYNKLFHYAARYHDVAYGNGTKKSIADMMFYRMMLSVSKTRKQKLFAYIYYNAVVIFGEYFYKRLT